MGGNPYNDLRKKVVFDLLEKFPTSGSRTIARIVVRDNPGLYKDVEDARGIIRMYRGQYGKQHREEVKFNKYYTHESKLA